CRAISTPPLQTYEALVAPFTSAGTRFQARLGPKAPQCSKTLIEQEFVDGTSRCVNADVKRLDIR
ncbi:MAG TPA: hypothetical protein VNQ74_11230, partial [Burkholderiaceae bacterium]|nr:hypothetical protein [Burkholderiaceae bacterium]